MWLLERFPSAPFAIVVAACGFLVLERGNLLHGGGVSAVAYAEAVHHEVAPVVSGRVIEIRARVGQQVKRGDIIAVMDDRTVAAARERARAELAKRRAEVTAAMLEQHARVTRAELALIRARAEAQGDRARLEEVSRQMARLDELLERKMVPASDVESAHEKARELTARVEAYDRGAKLLQESGTHRSRMDAWLEPHRLAVAVQEAAIAELDRALEDLTLRAPTDGTVTMLWRQAGDAVAAASPIATVVDARPGVVVALVPETAALRVAVGAKAAVRREGLLSRPMDGEVIEIVPEVEELPPRGRASPTIPAWGRRAFIQLRGGSELVPGEAFHVTLR